MAKLRPQYHYFKSRKAAREFAKKKRARSRVHRWIIRRSVDGYTVYNIRK